MNGGGPGPFNRDNGWGGPMNQPSGMMSGGGLGGNQGPPHMGGGNMGQSNGGGPGKTSTQVTIPKDVLKTTQFNYAIK